MARMHIVALLIFGCAVCFAQTAAAEETSPAPPSAHQAADATPSTIDRIRDLIEAGDHLEAAGAFDLARQVRAQAESLMVREGARLAHEEEQLMELSRELHQTQIMIQALIVEAERLPADFLVRMIGQYGGELISPDSATAAARAPTASGGIVTCAQNGIPLTSWSA